MAISVDLPAVVWLNHRIILSSVKHSQGWGCAQLGKGMVPRNFKSKGDLGPTVRELPSENESSPLKGMPCLGDRMEGRVGKGPGRGA